MHRNATGGCGGGAEKEMFIYPRIPSSPETCRTVRLAGLGKRPSGSAIGAMLVKFLVWCGKNGYCPIFDVRGVERIGTSLIEGAIMQFRDFEPSFAPSAEGPFIIARFASDEAFLSMKRLLSELSPEGKSGRKETNG